MIVEPGADFTCDSHLWVGNGLNNQGTVIINGGTAHVLQQLGVSWNGIGGTNYIYITNGSLIVFGAMGSPTLGYPGSSITNFGIMDIGANSQVVVTNNQFRFYEYPDNK